jgi:teichuronic acid biosynthesis glycosyltransferase TuaC
MKILIVCSGNHKHGISSFIKEQADSLISRGAEIEYFLVKGRKAFGYLKNYFPMRKVIRAGKFDLIHAHHGLSGMLAVLQRMVPVVVTFHGGDIDQRGHCPVSFLASRLSARNIYVYDLQSTKIYDRGNSAVIPCGIDMDIFHPTEKMLARQTLNLDLEKRYILFASSFEGRPEKNYPLARDAVKLIEGNIEMIELKGFDRNTVSLIFSAVDLLLLTSSREASPMVVKEALACNCPVVATDVGDIVSTVEGVEGCYITSLDIDDIATNIRRALAHDGNIEGRHRVRDLDLSLISERIMAEYAKIIRTNS